MSNESQKGLFDFVSNGLIEKETELDILPFEKDSLIISGFDEFDHGIGGLSYEKTFSLYSGRQEISLVVFFKQDEESF